MFRKLKNGKTRARRSLDAVAIDAGSANWFRAKLAYVDGTDISLELLLKEGGSETSVVGPLTIPLAHGELHPIEICWNGSTITFIGLGLLFSVQSTITGGALIAADGLLAGGAIRFDSFVAHKQETDKQGCGACSRVALAIAIYNYNHARDDNFKILLNGHEIGTIDNNQNNCTGRIFSSDTSVATWAEISCNSHFESTVLLDFDDLVEGTNTLRVESVQDNGNNNLGGVYVSRLYYDDGDWIEYESLLDSGYGFISGVGNGNDFEFEWPF